MMPDPTIAEATRAGPWFVSVGSAILAAVSAALVKTNQERIAALERLVGHFEQERDRCRGELDQLRARLDALKPQGRIRP